LLIDVKSRKSLEAKPNNAKLRYSSARAKAGSAKESLSRYRYEANVGVEIGFYSHATLNSGESELGTVVSIHKKE
jgi:hypothetical protein